MRNMRQRQAKTAVKLAPDNPRQAIAMAASLEAPDEDARQIKCHTLLQIAQTLQKNEPGFAKQAIEELVKNTTGLNYEGENRMLRDATALLIKMEENDAAFKVIKRGMELAEKMYDQDRDSGDPNEAIRPYWPSAAIWKTFITLAGRISPQTALEEIKEVRDPEIQTFTRAALANTLLGNKGGMMIMREIRKSGKDEYSMFDERD